LISGFEPERFSSVRHLCSDEAVPFVRRSVDRTDFGARVVCDARQGSS
jgi:hypothetical protein